MNKTHDKKMYNIEVKLTSSSEDSVDGDTLNKTHVGCFITQMAVSGEWCTLNDPIFSVITNCNPLVMMCCLIFVISPPQVVLVNLIQVNRVKWDVLS